MESVKENSQENFPQDTTYKYYKKPKNILFTLVVAIIVGGIFFALLNQFELNSEKQEGSSQENTKEEKFLSNHILTYGAWGENESIIYSYDLSTSTQYQLARLPENVKEVTPLPQNRLLYMANTDEKDHGDSLEIVTLSKEKDGTKETIYTPKDNFKIDDYVVSSNKRYVALWEVQFSSETNILQGGKSRVVTLDLESPQNFNVIYDEAADVPVHYPVAITNDGEVLLDTFLPNAGAGWAHGMSISDFDGTQQENLQNMQNGTYNSENMLPSPDGKKIVFVGYDGTQGEGTQPTEEGFRRALMSSNTIEILNTQTRERTKLNLPNTAFYTRVNWNGDNSTIIFSRISSTNAEDSGTFTYNLDTEEVQKIEVQSNRENNQERPTHLLKTPEITITGLTHETADDFIGNLGPTYSQSFTNVTVQKNDEEVVLPLATNLIQIISIQPTNTATLFSNNQAGSNMENENIGKIVEVSETEETNSLHIKPFYPKANLKSERALQQSDPPPLEIEQEGKRLRCRDYEAAQREQCNAIANETQRRTCHNQIEEVENCYDSPLYLYGPQGLHVKATIHTHTYNESPISQNNTYALILGEKNKFTYQANTYDSIDFDYSPAITVNPPLYGEIVARENVEKKAREYAQKLGLNKQETNDIVSDIKSSITKKYVFISFYDQQTSKLMLPIEFTPQPNTYINYIFYLKNLDTKESLLYSPKKPNFPQIPERGDFTAVEISTITR